MHAGQLVFSQLMEFVPWRRFETCVRRYGGDHKIKTFPCGEHLRVMAFAQLTYRESLRDIETCLRAVQAKWCHMGLRGGVCATICRTPIESATGESTPTSPRS